MKGRLPTLVDERCGALLSFLVSPDSVIIKQVQSRERKALLHIHGKC